MEQYQIDDMLSNLQSYLEGRGIDTRKLFRCINPDHTDSNASMKYFDDNKVFCFGCRANYNLVDVISIMEGLDKKEAFKKAMNTYCFNNLPKVEAKPKVEKQTQQKNYEAAYKVWRELYKKSKEAKEYIKSRGISEEVASRFNLGFNAFDFGDFKLKAVVIPITNNGFTARNIDKDNTDLRYYKSRGCHIEMFNNSALTNDIPYCVITEGEFDCMSFETIGANSLALCSANNIGKFISAEKSTNKTYILALDNDSAGNKAKEALIDYFNENNIQYREFDNCGFKDANMALVSNRKLFEEEIFNLIEEIEKQNKKKRNHDIEM